MRDDRLCLYAAQVALATAPIVRGIAVEHLLPETAVRHAQPVAAARHGREVAGHQHNIVRRATAPQEAEHAVISVVGVDPFEARRIAIELVQRRLAVSQEIGALRAAAGGTRLSLSREQQVLSRFRTALGPEGAALGMVLLRQGRGRL